MIIREATIRDYKEMHTVRLAVKENVLNNSLLVTYKDYEEMLSRKGKGWICMMNGIITGFAIVDLSKNNVWALFVLPEYEGKGIGSRLHDTMLDWYFAETNEAIWLSTDRYTRAQKFYLSKGWIQTGEEVSGEVRMKLSYDRWVT